MTKGNLKIAATLLVSLLFIFSALSAKEISIDAKQKAKKAKTEQKSDLNQTTPTSPTTTTTEVEATTTPMTSKSDLPTKSAAGETINWQVISNGGGYGSSTNYQLHGTIGQNAVGIGTSSNYTLISGFWQDFGTGSLVTCCIGIRGNIDGDLLEVIDVSDLVYMVDYQFRGGPAPGCDYEADLAEISEPPIIDVSDLVYMVDYQFRGGPGPADCP